MWTEMESEWGYTEIGGRAVGVEKGRDGLGRRTGSGRSASEDCLTY